MYCTDGSIDLIMIHICYWPLAEVKYVLYGTGQYIS